MRLGPNRELPTIEDRELTDPAYFFDQSRPDMIGLALRLQRNWQPDDGYIDEPWLYDEELPGISGTQDSGTVYPADSEEPVPWR